MGKYIQKTGKKGNSKKSEFFTPRRPPHLGDRFRVMAHDEKPRSKARLTRLESDAIGELELPAGALHGVATQRAVLNFPISGYRFGRAFLRALGLIKWAAATVNHQLGLLDTERAEWITRAAQEMIEGRLDEHFLVDIFQTGSGTSTNMNANEVIANRCSQLAGRPLGSHEPVHPNDHVNLGQSSNDVIPTAIHISAGELLHHELMPALERLHEALEQKSLEFWEILKIGRTHLADATPIRLGQEFSGYARQVEFARLRVGNAIAAIEEVALGGTAVGTGLNCHPAFATHVVHQLWARTGIAFREARNHFEAQGAQDSLVQASGQFKTVAVSLFKIANDLRWLASGPHGGLGEITLPALQPGSSIMPGKVNPVMCEMLMQVCAQVIGNDATITWAGANGNFELNTMLPVMGFNLLESIRLLTRAAELFRARCIEGITANPERCAAMVAQSESMATALVPMIGYDQAAEIAKMSHATGKTVREVCREWAILPEETLEHLLDASAMTRPSLNPHV
jgi:fumarate hydratase class II